MALLLAYWIFRHSAK